MQQVAAEGPWVEGINSIDHPAALRPGQYQWAVNVLNKGGVISTRPGVASTLKGLGGAELGGYNTPVHSLAIFTPRDGVPVLVMSVGVSTVQYVPYPFTGPPGILSLSTGGSLNMNASTIQFETAVLGVSEDSEGNITAIDPYPVLMMCDGLGRSAVWDGATMVRLLDPGLQETPVATWMKWIGNRLWTAQGKKIRVSNIMNPIKFTGENILIEGGYFNLPGDCTGFGTTPDFRSLLAFTETTTSSFQASILNRAAWFTTVDFQKVLFSNIGCVSGRAIVNQYGMTWWFSHGGLISLDNALQTYRSSEIKLQDSMMRRSRSGFAPDLSKMCMTAYDNYLLVSGPSGDAHNYHTWVMDRNPLESGNSSPAWASVWSGFRPTQWATGVIDGAMRCFCSSCDIAPIGFTASIIKGNVWEVFMRDRRDIGYNSSAARVAKNVSCAFETRMVATPQLSQIKYLEVDIEEAVGTIQLDIYYATRRGTYKKFGSKQIVATVNGMNTSTRLENFSPQFLPVLPQYLPQRRTIRSVNESLLDEDFNPVVETDQTRNIDRHFSFLLKWTGQMSISRIKVFADVIPESLEGVAEDNETTDRYIRPNGTGAVSTSGAITPMPIVSGKSEILPVLTPRWSEDVYNSLS